MSERDFNMIAPTIWKSARFASLPPAAKLLHMFLLTSPHQTSAGGFRLPAAYAAEDIGCTSEEFVQNMSVIVEAGIAIYDEATKEVFVPGWYRHCPPTNLKHAKGIAKVIARMSSDTIRAAMEEEFAKSEWGGKLAAQGADEAHPFDTPMQNNRLLNTALMRGRATG